MIKLNLLRPKYEGHYCGHNEYIYRTDTLAYLWVKICKNYWRTRGTLIDITSNTEVEIKVGTGFSCRPTIR